MLPIFETGFSSRPMLHEMLVRTTVYFLKYNNKWSGNEDEDLNVLMYNTVKE